MNNQQTHSLKRVIIFIFISALLFGTMEVTLKLTGNSLDPFQTTFYRFLIGGIVLLPFGIFEQIKNDYRMTLKDWMWMLLLGVLCVPMSMVIFQIGILMSNAATAAVVFSINPVFTVICAHFLTQFDKFTKNKIIAIILGAIGIILMIRPWNIQEGNTFEGAALLIAAAAIFSLYSVIGAKTISKIGTFAQTAYSFLIGSFVLLIIMLVRGMPIIDGFQENIGVILYLGIFITGGGYLFYFLAIKYSNVTTGSIVFFLKPVIAPIFAVIILSEKITWNMYLGIAIILVASYLIINEKRKGTKNEGNKYLISKRKIQR